MCPVEQLVVKYVAYKGKFNLQMALRSFLWRFGLGSDMGVDIWD